MKGSFTVIDTTPDEATLHAYVDGELSAGERGDVEAWLANNPRSLVEVNLWRRQNQILKRLSRTERLPAMTPEMSDSASALGRAMSRSRLPTRATAGAAMIALLAAGTVLAGLNVNRDSGALPEGFARQALDAHRSFSVLSDVRPESASLDGASEASLAGGLGAIVGSPPDLRAAGLTLAMHRVVTDGTQPAAQFLYVGTGGGRVSVYVRHAELEDGRPYEFLRHRGAGTLYWQSQGLAFALVGNLGEPRLLEIAATFDSSIKHVSPGDGARDEALASSETGPAQAGTSLAGEHKDEVVPSGTADDVPTGGGAEEPSRSGSTLRENPAAQET